MIATGGTAFTSAERPTRFRWIVCALLFAATTINYVDRQILGLLKPALTAEFGWSEIDYGNIVFAFQTAYAIGLLGSGWLLDRIGPRAGYGFAVALWSLAAAAHALAKTVFGFVAARFALGLAEAANFPAAVKVVARWFPESERALAIGIFNAGSNVGAIITPLAVPVIVLTWGWQSAFIVAGSLGFVWLAAWLWLYHAPEQSRHVNAAERLLIGEAVADARPKLAWRTLVGSRPALAFAIAKFLTDPVWWFYLFWLPDFLHKQYGLGLVSFGPPLVVIFLLADVGSVGGGWLSSHLIKRGWRVDHARKATMLLCALSALGIAFASGADSLWLAVALIGLGTAAHQAWSANLFTIVADTQPREAVGTVVGFGGAAGAVGGMLMAQFAGRVLDASGNYALIFAVLASAYLVALTIIHLMLPRFGREEARP